MVEDLFVKCFYHGWVPGSEGLNMFCEEKILSERLRKGK